jgi:hypothetical protein
MLNSRFIKGIMNRQYYIYDLEVYPNVFLFGGKFRGTNEVQIFEISDRMNESQKLLSWLSYLKNLEVEMVGFNSIAYDYIILHELLTNPYTFSYEKAFQVSQQIFTSQGRGANLLHVRHSERVIPQIDIVKFCHFDNDAKRTSLKALQFAMRSESLEDLPFKIRPLNNQEKDQLRSYNAHDVTETEKFFNISEHLVDMRREYLDDGVLQGDVLNYSDVKIGVEYLISRLGRNKCYAGGKPRQTFRTQIEFNKIILPKITYRTEVFQEVLSWFKKQTIYISSESPKPSLVTQLAGLEFHFGIGGVHASADNKIYSSDDDFQIIDIDVSGMYVAVAIANGFAPEHLGEAFSAAYRQIKEDRARYPKGSSRNAALKLAGNGAYGMSNNPYSPLYDPQYTFSVTVNGQLQLLQMVELIDLLPDCELIQANTDGITVRIKKENEWLFKAWCKEWEKLTNLELEEVRYSRMWIRDVNNYIAEKIGKDGTPELKRKGAYWYPLNTKEYEGWWNKDFSNLASIKAAEKAMTHSWPLEAAIKLITDPFDFMLRYKATGESRLFIGEDEQLKTVRYYVSISGKPMKKVSPPKGEVGQFKRKNSLKDEVFNAIMKEIGKDVWDDRIHTKNKSKYGIVETSVQSGWLVKECNIATKFDWKDVDWKYYIEEAQKLIVGSK